MRSVLSIERELRRYAGAIQARYVAQLKYLFPDGAFMHDILGIKNNIVREGDSKALGTLRNNFLPKFVSRSRANKLAIKRKAGEHEGLHRKLAMAISAYLDRSLERRDRIAERTKQIYVLMRANSNEQIEESRDALQLARELNEIMREENGERQP